MISFKNVSKIFCSNFDRSRRYAMHDIFLGRPKNRLRPDEFYALKEVSLDVRAGEVVHLMGPTGSGKSTLCRLMYGLIKPSDGLVKVKGTCLMVGHSRLGLNPLMEVREALRFSLALIGTRSQDIQKKYQEVLSFLGLTVWEKRKFHDLPDPLRRAVMVCVPLLAEADVYIFDGLPLPQPTDLREKCLQVIRGRRGQKTLIFSGVSEKTIPLNPDRAIVLLKSALVHSGDYKTGCELANQFISENKPPQETDQPPPAPFFID